jgi:hypothetical protein
MRPTGAEADIDFESLRGAEAPLFHGVTRMWEFFGRGYRPYRRASSFIFGR